MPKVLVSDPLEIEGIERLKEGGAKVDVKLGLPEDELVKIIGGYDALVVRSQTKVTKKIIDAGKKLKIIGRAGIGVDNIDVLAASAKGIIVINAPSASVTTTAEHAMSMMMALARKIPQATASVKGGDWKKSKFTGVELRRKTLGVIGLGKIGSEAARIAGGIGMKVIAYDPFVSLDYATKLGVQVVTKEVLLKNSDFITIHSALTKDSKNLIGEKEIGMMKKGVRIINCARGGIINEAALVAGIKSGKIAGAALDVYEKEPVEKTNPLLSMDEVILTPHIAASTAEAQTNIALEIADQMVVALDGGLPTTAVNLPKMDFPAELRPYIALAEKLGSFGKQMISNAPSTVELTFSGDAFEKVKVSIITIALVKELLGGMLDENVTYVNALSIAKERGIGIVETVKRIPSVYSSLLSVTIHWKEGKTVLSGTVMSAEDVRIVEINDCLLDLKASGNILLTIHNDKPGIVASVATLLANEGINIAEMELGRKSVGGDAIMTISIDNYVSDAVLKKIGRISDIKDVKMIKLQ